MPYEVAGKTTTQVVVEYQKVKGAAVAVPVVEAVPGLFSINSSGTGPGAFLNENNSVNTAANPLERGKIAIFYGTGEGQTTPGGVSGLPATTIFPKPVLPVTVTIGGKSAEVLYYGAAPYMVAGVIQINARVPTDIAAGNAEVVMKVRQQYEPERHHAGREVAGGAHETIPRRNRICGSRRSITRRDSLASDAAPGGASAEPTG